MKDRLLGFSIGALCASVWPLLSLLLSPFILLFFVWMRPRFLSLMLCAMAGCIWVCIHLMALNEPLLPIEQGRQLWQLTGTVGPVSKQQKRLQFDFYPQGPFKRLKVSCYRCPFAIERGQQWQLALKIKPFVSFHNPEGFDYRFWMLSKGYDAQASVKIKHGYNKRLKVSSYGLINQISHELPSEQRPILRALLLGDKNGLSADYKRFINASGLGHLFVVSGLHVGIAFAAMVFLLLWLQRPLLLFYWPYSRVFAFTLGLALACFYAYLSGLNVPVVRTCIMLFCGAFMLLQKRNTGPMYYFILALVFVLLLTPLAFMNMGSWLSFGIVGALLIGLSGSPAQPWYKQLWRAQWLAFGTSSMLLLAFNQGIAPTGFVLNLFFIPLVTILILPLALISLLFALLGFDGGLGLLEYFLTSIFEFLLEGQWFLTWHMPFHQGSFYLAIMAFFMFLLPKALGLRLLAFTVLLVALCLPTTRPEKGGFELTVLDVGQGSSALIETQSHVVLVDTGTRYSSGMTLADYVVLPYLRMRNIRTIDTLLISHDDLDHSGGRDLLRPMSLKVLNQQSCDHNRWIWDGVIFETFKAAVFNKGNNGSCLLRVEDSKGRSVLLSGDIEAKAENALIKEGWHLKADVLLVPHHGSQTSSSNAFLDKVNPQVVIISAGQLNHYGHPHKRVLQRFKARSYKVYSTATHGAIQVGFEPRQEALSVSTYRPIEID